MSALENPFDAEAELAKARAEVARLRAVLREIVNVDPEGLSTMGNLAHKALAVEQQVPLSSLSDDELRHKEYVESCSDDGYGPRLRALRQEMALRADER